MDEIFQEVKGLRGALDVVRAAREKPRRYGKNGELLINYDGSEFARRRRSSAAGAQGGVLVDKAEHINGSEERKEAV